MGKQIIDFLFQELKEDFRCNISIYVRILGSNQEVVRLKWLIKYVSPAEVTACSQPSGNGPNSGSDDTDVAEDNFVTGFPVRVKIKL